MSHIVELHLHLDGSLRPETVWELAKEQGVELPAKSAEEVKSENKAEIETHLNKGT